jgi:ribose 1,5-bisphosphate isomerase
METDSEVHPAVAETAEAIETMEVRGAAAIADAAARAIATQAAESDAATPAALRAELRAAAAALRDTRPTAVSLPNALRFVLGGIEGDTVESIREATVESARAFRERLDGATSELGRVGANRLRDGDVVMTHCHSTEAIACVEAAVEAGKRVEAIVKETRPRKQGHLTARDLRELGVPVTLIVDGAARRYLNDVDHVLVGADSIAADGSVVNKVGTSGLAVNARDRGTPVMVAAQTIKLAPETLTGHTVEIEMRDERELLSEDRRAEIGDPAVENPAFDVTPPRYVDAIVTERGQFPPESVVTLMRELFGESVTRPWEAPEGSVGADDR